MKFQWNKQYSDAVLIALAVIFPIILSGVPIGDDYNRLYSGVDFYNVGRFGATWLFQILSADKFLFNLFPLPQILGIIIYAISLSWVIQKINITNRLSNNLILLLSLSFPFIFQNYSFQYDCLTMCIGLSIFSISSFILIPKENNKINLFRYSILKVGLLLLGLIFYQPALISFVIFSVFNFLLSREDDRKLKILFWHAFVLISAYLIDYFVVLSFGDTGYYKRKSFFMFSLVLDNIIINSVYFIEIIKPYYKNIFVIISHLIILFFAFNSVYSIYKTKKNDNLLNKIILLLSIPIIMFITIIIMSVPSNQVIAPSRLLLSMSSAYTCIALIAFKENKYTKLLHIAIILAIIPAVTILCITTNTANIQAKYEKMLISSMYQGLSKIEKQDNQKIFFACDKHWFSPYTKKVITRYPYIMEFILTDHLRKWYFIEGYMGDYHIKNAKEFSYLEFDEKKIKKILETHKDSKHLYHHYLYDIYNFDEKIIVCVKPT